MKKIGESLLSTVPTRKSKAYYLAGRIRMRVTGFAKILTEDSTVVIFHFLPLKVQIDV